MYHLTHYVTRTSVDEQTGRHFTETRATVGYWHLTKLGAMIHLAMMKEELSSQGFDVYRSGAYKCRLFPIFGEESWVIEDRYGSGNKTSEDSVII